MIIDHNRNAWFTNRAFFRWCRVIIVINPSVFSIEKFSFYFPLVIQVFFFLMCLSKSLDAKRTPTHSMTDSLSD